MSYDQANLQRIVEGALLAAGEALTVDRLLNLFEESERPEKAEVTAALVELQAQTEGRGFELVEVASGWRFQVAHDLAYWVNRLWEEKPQKYSRALLETLSLIAYRQPITRGDIEEVRGVAVSSHIIKTLAEREWIKVVGHRDVPGRPSLYATTRQFLDYFGLKSLEQLPTLSELRDIDGLNESLALDEANEEQEQIAEAKSMSNEDTQDTPAQGDGNIKVDPQPQVEEVPTPPTSLEEEVDQHNRSTVGGPGTAPDQGSDESNIHVDAHPQVVEVSTPPLTLEEEVHQHNKDEVGGDANIASVGDEAGADVQYSEDSAEHRAKPSPLFDSRDASGEPDRSKSSGDAPEDQ